jgi:hypothetical protein
VIIIQRFVCRVSNSPELRPVPKSAQFGATSAVRIFDELLPLYTSAFDMPQQSSQARVKIRMPSDVAQLHGKPLAGTNVKVLHTLTQPSSHRINFFFHARDFVTNTDWDKRRFRTRTLCLAEANKNCVAFRPVGDLPEVLAAETREASARGR